MARVKAELEQINSQNNVSILLLPLGYAAGHYDQRILKKLRKKYSLDAQFFEKLTIFEITFLISKARLFIGTSLHGNIISMSYGVPHIGLKSKNSIIKKLEDFLYSWAIPELNHCLDISELAQNYTKISRIQKSDIIEQTNIMKKKVYAQFEVMFGPH